MGRFFDKSELIIIMSMILLFDINASITEFLNYIYYSNISGLIPYILIMGALLIDIHMLKMTIDIEEEEEEEDKIDPKGEYLKKAKNLIIFFVLVSLIITFIVSVFKTPIMISGESINSFGTRAMRASPLLFVIIYLIHNID